MCYGPKNKNQETLEQTDHRKRKGHDASTVWISHVPYRLMYVNTRSSDAEVWGSYEPLGLWFYSRNMLAAQRQALRLISASGSCWSSLLFGLPTCRKKHCKFFLHLPSLPQQPCLSCPDRLCLWTLSLKSKSSILSRGWRMLLTQGSSQDRKWSSEHQIEFTLLSLEEDHPALPSYPGLRRIL